MSTTRIIALLLILALSLWSCDKGKDPKPVPPTAPNLLSVINITYNSITLNWNDLSTTEEGFEIEMQDGANWNIVGSVNADVTQFTVQNLTQNTPYTFRVFAFNNAGRSDASNEAEATTQAFNPPPAPGSVTAFALAPTVVQVNWLDTAPMAVVFVIDRKTDVTDWNRVGQVGDNMEVFVDSTCAAATTYYFRVGATANGPTTFSVDSAMVATPAIGTPHQPSDLTAVVQLGTGVSLHWTDNSLDETEFHIRRNVSGQFFEIIDTVAANSVSYIDSLGDNIGEYNYQVRSANSFGASGWSNIATARYDYCSAGAVPICLENYWDYEVDPPTGSIYNVRRQVRGVAYPNGVDYYLLVEINGEEMDTLFYWRNFDNGLYQDSYPIDPDPGQLLLRTPASSGFWNFFGDSVIVTSASVTVTVQGTVYTGVTIYQRFSRVSNASIKYYLKPNTIGIIKEEEYINSSLQTTRELTGYHLR